MNLSPVNVHFLFVDHVMSTSEQRKEDFVPNVTTDIRDVVVETKYVISFSDRYVLQAYY